MTSKGFLTFVAGETQVLKFTVTYKEDGTPVNVATGNTCTLLVRQADVANHFTKTDASFDKGQGGVGILKVLCTFSTEGIYDGIFTIVFGGGTTKKLLFGIKVKGIN